MLNVAFASRPNNWTTAYINMVETTAEIMHEIIKQLVD